MTCSTSGASATIEITTSTAAATRPGWRPHGAGIEQRLHGFGAARPDHDLVSALQKIEGHRPTHDAQPEKPIFMLPPKKYGARNRAPHHILHQPIKVRSNVAAVGTENLPLSAISCTRWALARRST